MTDPDGFAIHLRRTIQAPRERVYAAMTKAEIARKWWVMDPWEFVGLTLDATPGGRFE